MQLYVSVLPVKMAGRYPYGAPAHEYFVQLLHRRFEFPLRELNEPLVLKPLPAPDDISVIGVPTDVYPEEKVRPFSLLE
ncbi:MAG: hypothetical protein KDC66_17345 [Phaeodactylibacter sp.]|nr:hypothetical protein [Phaeodactylibacter sp.]